jgi:N6-adenosine-specific RNA methylase IME4
MSWHFDHLTPLRYGAILADPPWPYTMRSEKGHRKSPEAHYPTMSMDQLAALPVHQLAARDCYLFMWSTWPHLGLAMGLMKDWGFEYVTGGSWTKRSVNWKVTMGTGYVLRSATEPFLVGKIGRPQPLCHSERGLIDAPRVVLQPDDVPDAIDAVRREHSRKPVQMREMIDRLLPQSYFCELFGREPWAGHDVWGNQADKFAAPESGAA